MKSLIVLFIFLISSSWIYATDKVLSADFRHRPPEMILEGKKMSGPLKDILEEAANTIGFQVRWKSVPFARSLDGLKKGNLDILPRTVRTEEREKFVNYLGPIGFQEKSILFLVKKGQENQISKYEDLQGLKIAVKRKTAYFKQFDQDSTLNKQAANDDKNMAKMFQKGRFDAMAVLDRTSIEKALEASKVTNYSYANYKYVQRSGNYYGMSQTSANAGVYNQLNQVLLDMAKSGKVTAIYQQYGVPPPLQN